MRAGLEEIAADAIQLRFALERRTEPHILGALRGGRKPPSNEWHSRDSRLSLPPAPVLQIGRDVSLTVGSRLCPPQRSSFRSIGRSSSAAGRSRT